MALADFPRNIGYSTCGLIIYVGLGVGGGGIGSSPAGRGGPVPINIQVGGGEVFSPGLTGSTLIGVGGALDGGGGSFSEGLLGALLGSGLVSGSSLSVGPNEGESVGSMSV